MTRTPGGATCRRYSPTACWMSSGSWSGTRRQLTLALARAGMIVLAPSPGSRRECRSSRASGAPTRARAWSSPFSPKTPGRRWRRATPSRRTAAPAISRALRGGERDAPCRRSRARRPGRRRRGGGRSSAPARSPGSRPRRRTSPSGGRSSARRPGPRGTSSPRSPTQSEGMPRPNIAVSLTQTKSASRSFALSRSSDVEVVAADLLFALDDELQVDGELARRPDERLDGLDVDVDLPLVVDDARAPRGARRGWRARRGA